MKRRCNALPYNHIREPISSKILEYHLIDERLDPVNKVSKKGSRCNMCNHRKPLLLYSLNTNGMIRPAEESVEKAKIILQQYSRTTHPFQSSGSLLPIFISII
jgi:hypothetical protein